MFGSEDCTQDGAVGRILATTIARDVTILTAMLQDVDELTLQAALSGANVLERRVMQWLKAGGGAFI